MNINSQQKVHETQIKEIEGSIQEESHEEKEPSGLPESEHLQNDQDDDEEALDNVPDVLPLKAGHDRTLPHVSSNVAAYAASLAVLPQGQNTHRNAVLHRNNIDAKAPMMVSSSKPFDIHGLFEDVPMER